MPLRTSRFHVATNPKDPPPLNAPPPQPKDSFKPLCRAFTPPDAAANGDAAGGNVCYQRCLPLIPSIFPDHDSVMLRLPL